MNDIGDQSEGFHRMDKRDQRRDSWFGALECRQGTRDDLRNRERGRSTGKMKAPGTVENRHKVPGKRHGFYATLESARLSVPLRDREYIIMKAIIDPINKSNERN